MFKVLLSAALLITATSAVAERPEDHPFTLFKDVLLATSVCLVKTDRQVEFACLGRVMQMADKVHRLQAVHAFVIMHQRLGNHDQGIFPDLVKKADEYLTYHCAVKGSLNTDWADAVETASLCSIEERMTVTMLLSLAEIGRIVPHAPADYDRIQPKFRAEFTAVHQLLTGCLAKPDSDGACAARAVLTANHMLTAARDTRREYLDSLQSAQSATAWFDKSFAAWTAYRDGYCAVTAAAAPDGVKNPGLRDACLTNLNLMWVLDAFHLPAPPTGRAI